MNGGTPHRLAHDREDTTKRRSKDVAAVDGTSFSSFPLAQESLHGLKQCGFKQPSPIQLQAIPLGLCGFDLVVQSKAGTGKTCIFALIALEAVKFSSRHFTQTLILAPTREVAIQIHGVISLLSSCYLDVGCILCIGGVDVKQDRSVLAGKNCQIAIGTPGRIKQLIELGILKVQQLELFVLDEADKLMDDQFKTQIDEIYKRLPADKQMVVTSATYPDELSSFLQHYMKVPKIMRLGQELQLEAIQEYYVESRAGHSTKKTIENKLGVLKTILGLIKFAKVIIFTNFQARAPMVCDALNQDGAVVAKHGRVSYICAELAQLDRCRVFDNFKSSSADHIMISTDISARGIDIQDIDLVINFDLPHDRPTYYHRIGRAGRFGQPGKAISIVCSDVIDQRVFEKNVLSDKIDKITV